jgi:hypothetical protein
MSKGDVVELLAMAKAGVGRVAGAATNPLRSAGGLLSARTGTARIDAVAPPWSGVGVSDMGDAGREAAEIAPRVCAVFAGRSPLMAGRCRGKGTGPDGGPA